MEIKINLPNWKCENLLYMHDYKIEEVTAYYNDDLNPYGDEENVENLKPMNIKIAYPKAHKLLELEKEYPRLHVLQDFEYEKVVNRLFNSELWELIVNKS